MFDLQRLPPKIQYLKLKRTQELNNKLKKELERERITASNACLNIIDFALTTQDYTLPEIWGYMQPGQNHFRKTSKQLQAPGMTTGGLACCRIM